MTASVPSLSPVDANMVPGDLPATSSLRAPGRPVVIVVESLEETNRLRDIWKSWRAHPDSDIDTYLTLFKCRPDLIHPYVAVIHRNDRQEAMLAARTARAELSFRVGYLNLFRTTVRALNVPYGGVQGTESPENCRLLVGTVWEALLKGDADVAIFESVRLDSPFYAAIKQRCGLFEYSRPTIHRYMKLPGSIAELYRLRPDIRQRRNRCRNKLRAQCHGDTTVRLFMAPAEAEDFMQVAEEVAHTTYQRALAVGFNRDDPQTWELVRLGARQGWFRGHVLYAREAPIAFLASRVYQNTAYLDFSGFDNKYARCSPGLLLMIHALEEFCSEGISGADFGLGDSPYKEYFSTECWLEAPLYLFRPSLKGELLKVARTGTLALDDVFKRVLQRTGLLARVKKAWRSLLVEQR